MENYKSKIVTAEAAVAAAVKAVSYTHLDVYKRQPVSRPCVSSSP